MNPYYYQPMQPPHVSPVLSPWSVYDGHRSTPVYYTPMMMSYPQSMQYVDDVAILDTNQEVTHSYIGQNDDQYYYGHEFEAYLENRLMMIELEDEREFQRVTGRNGSGLSMEEISKRLRVYAAERETSADYEVETCSICLDDCEKKVKTARLECGHRFHVGCITRWLMSKNVCPMCRSTALTV